MTSIFLGSSLAGAASSTAAVFASFAFTGSSSMTSFSSDERAEN